MVPTAFGTVVSRVNATVIRANGSEYQASLAKAKYMVRAGEAKLICSRPYTIEEYSTREYREELADVKGRQMSGVTHSLLDGSSANEGMQQRRVRPPKREKAEWEEDFERHKKDYLERPGECIVLAVKSQKKD